ncbi:Hypothetical_protein [Hexamita inflata]|uniref:Hypothetical_protein n=1 Tax=Hexamita inflata TaxID=28002 RepID=A0ABP1GGD2_9EUKA
MKGHKISDPVIFKTFDQISNTKRTYGSQRYISQFAQTQIQYHNLNRQPIETIFVEKGEMEQQIKEKKTQKKLNNIQQQMNDANQMMDLIYEQMCFGERKQIKRKLKSNFE